MSKFYNARRSRNLYDPNSTKPFKVSRSKIDLFIECPRCFYIDRRLGTGRPPGFPFNINSAVDNLLKNEFDAHRAQGSAHPLTAAAGLDVVPAPRDEIDEWRKNFTGVQSLHEPTNLILFGAIDDLWVDPDGNYFVVDYKATAKAEPVTKLDQAWQAGYKRQMEIYQWLLRQNGLTVSNTGYFVYCTGNPNAPKFGGRVEFETNLIPYVGNDDWVEKTIADLHACLQAESIPDSGDDCDHCAYIGAVGDVNGGAA